MISAKQAKELVDNSKKAVDSILDKIGAKIEERASDGHRSLNLTFEVDREMFKCHTDLYGNVKLTPFQEKIKQELLNERYGWEIQSTKNGGGLGSFDSDENEPTYTYSMKINW